MNKSKIPNYHEYSITTNEITATMLDTGATLFVVEGSYAAINEDSSLNKASRRLRKRLINTGVLVKHKIPNNNSLFNDLVKEVYKFSRTYPFKKPSPASNVVLGYESNGWIEWKDKNGKTYQDVHNGANIQNTMLKKRIRLEQIAQMQAQQGVAGNAVDVQGDIVSPSDEEFGGGAGILP